MPVSKRYDQRKFIQNLFSLKFIGHLKKTQISRPTVFSIQAWVPIIRLNHGHIKSAIFWTFSAPADFSRCTSYSGIHCGPPQGQNLTNRTIQRPEILYFSLKFSKSFYCKHQKDVLKTSHSDRFKEQRSFKKQPDTLCSSSRSRTWTVTNSKFSYWKMSPLDANRCCYKTFFQLFTFAFCRVHIFYFNENNEASDHLDSSISKESTLKNKSARAIWKIPPPLLGKGLRPPALEGRARARARAR